MLHGMMLALALFFAAADPEALIKQAEPIRSLDSFLDSFIGECAKGDAEQKKECLATSAKFRADTKGKTYSVDLPTRAFRKITPVQSKDPSTLLYEYTPIFDGGGYGLTFTKPTKTAKDGTILMKHERFSIPYPSTPGEEPAVLAAMKVDRLTVTLVFRTDDVWKVKRPGGFTYGMSVKPQLLRLQDSRGGETADTLF